MNIYELWEKALKHTEIIRPRILPLLTYARTELSYIFLAESVVNMNITTPLFLIQRFLPLLKSGSNIIFTGSSMAIFPHSVSISYGITKSAVHAMVKNLVKFLIPFNIRVNCVSPGFVDTEWQKDKPSDVRENIKSKISLKRFATPEEVASVYLFILESHYLNGEIITIDGGYSYQ